MTRTAAKADIVLPTASAYEKSGTMTNACGEVQRLRQCAKTLRTKTDAESVGLIGREWAFLLAQPMRTVCSRIFGQRFPATPFRE